MKPVGLLRAALLALLTLGVLTPGVLALFRFNDSRERLFLLLSTSLGWDSNVFASANEKSDTLVTAAASIDYSRRAGIIGVNASLGMELGRFVEFNSEDYVNPRASFGLVKTTGRTTGSLSLGAARESRADVAANVRAESWNYDSLFKVRYPVIDRYSLSGSLGYNMRDFTENPLLVDLATATASADLLYAYDSRRDLFAGYRLRLTDSALDTQSYDHAFTLGVTGRIIPRLNGTVRVGYQFRDTTGLLRNEDFSAVNAGIALTWTLSRRTNLTGQISKDFATTSTDITNDTVAATLDFKMAVNAKLGATAGVGYGTADFLGTRGAGRRDTYATATASAQYLLTEKVNFSLTASHLRNWSTLALADYDRNAVTLGLSCRF